MKKLINSRASNGFTLIEILVALLITAMLMVTIASIFLMAQKIYTRGGDISYKQKSITNIETELQNSLGRAMKVSIITRAPESTDDYDYYIGFDATDKCNIASSLSTGDAIKRDSFADPKTITNLSAGQDPRKQYMIQEGTVRKSVNGSAVDYVVYTVMVRIYYNNDESYIELKAFAKKGGVWA